MAEEKDDKAKADIVIEFLEVAFHSILYFRNVYPKAIFCIRKKYQVPVYISMHPQVNYYINESLKTAKFLLEEDSVKRIVLSIVNENELSLEKHCFDFNEVSPENVDTYFVRTEEAFREYLLKLSIAEDEEKKMQGDLSFRISIMTRENSSIRINEDPDRAHFPWIEEGEKNDENENGFAIFPIKTVETSMLKLNMYMEK